MSAVANGKLEAYTQEASKDLAFVVKDRWITTAEASQILNIAPQTLAVWRMLARTSPLQSTADWYAISFAMFLPFSKVEWSL